MFRCFGLAIGFFVSVSGLIAGSAQPVLTRDERNTIVSEKLDPNLQALVEGPGQQTAVQVIVGLSAPASEPQLDALRQSGLQVRSVIGDVLTGTAEVAKIPEIAQHDLVTKIEASAPLYPE